MIRFIFFSTLWLSENYIENKSISCHSIWNPMENSRYLCSIKYHHKKEVKNILCAAFRENTLSILYTFLLKKEKKSRYVTSFHISLKMTVQNTAFHRVYLIMKPGELYKNQPVLWRNSYFKLQNTIDFFILLDLDIKGCYYIDSFFIMHRHQLIFEIQWHSDRLFLCRRYSFTIVFFLLQCSP